MRFLESPGVCKVLKWFGVCEVLEWFGVCQFWSGSEGVIWGERRVGGIIRGGRIRREESGRHDKGRGEWEG